MSNKRSNYPNAQQIDAKPGEISAVVQRVEELRRMQPVKDDNEIEERIKWFFDWCIKNDTRPGVELLALSLGTTRQTLWNWQQTGGRRGDLVTMAKQVLAALLENWGQTGKLNPAAFCFLMKNNYGYADNVQLEVSQQNNNGITKTPEQIAIELGVQYPPEERDTGAPPMDF